MVVFSHDDTRPVLIVIGGGFAGMLACRNMRKRFRVVLVDAKDYFEFVPSIPRAFVHPNCHSELSFMYQSVCDYMGVNFIWGEVQKVLHKEKEVTIKRVAMPGADPQKMNYDYLLVTCGCQYTMFATHEKSASSANESLWYPSVLDYTVSEGTWGSLDERYIGGRRMHIENEAQKIKELADKKGTIVVVGGGPVGVEFATEVKYVYPELNVVLCEQREGCMLGLPDKARKYIQNWMDTHGIKCIYGFKYSNLGSGDSRKSDDTFLNENGVYPDRVYLAVGTLAQNAFMDWACLVPAKTKGRGGQIKVNKALQVVDGEGVVMSDCVYAAGACATIQDFERLPGKVAPSEEMAKHACQNIVAMSRSKPVTDMHYGGMGRIAMEFDLTSVGPRASTVVAFNRASVPGSGCLIFTGCLGSIMKEWFIGWTKIDQCKMGIRGRMFWGMVGH